MSKNGKALRDSADRIVRALGYALIGVVVLFAIADRWLRPPAGDSKPPLLQTTEQLLPGAKVKLTEMPGPEEKVVPYVEWRLPDGTSGYCYDSASLVQYIHGYAGPISIAVAVDEDGVLRAMKIQENNEDGEYLKKTEDWQRRLIGIQIFTPDELDKVDAVSGATRTSIGIRNTLKASGGSFSQALQGHLAARSKFLGDYVDHYGVVLLAGVIVVLLLRRRRSRALRIVVLIGTTLTCGIWLNLQYSTSQILTLMTAPLMAPRLGIPFLLVIGIPLIVLLLGNIYCGYLCPFGALQELIGLCRPLWLRTPPVKSVSRWTRLIKYGLLFFCTILFIHTADRGVVRADPLTIAFAGDYRPVMLGFILLILALSFLYPRFWCRNLCPTGAFLAMLNRVKALRFLQPRVNHQLCPFGVRDTGETDCICCDRCRHATKKEAKALKLASKQTRRVRDLVFVLLTVVVAILFLHLLILARTPPTPPPVPAEVAPDAEEFEEMEFLDDDPVEEEKPGRQRRYHGGRGSEEDEE